MREESKKNIEFIALMVMLVSLTALSIDTVLPALAIMRADLHVPSMSDMQFVISVLFIGYSFGQLVFGPISDALGRRKTIMIGLSIYVIGCVLCIFGDSLTMLLVGRALQGFGVAAPRINAIAIIRDRFSGNDMARIMSIVMAFFIFIPAIAPLLGQTILNWASWHEIFILLLIVALAVWVWFYFRLEETLPIDKRSSLSPKEIYKNASLFMTNKVSFKYSICGGLMFGVLASYLLLAQQILQGYYGVGQAFALYFAISALSIGLGSFLSATIVKRFGMRIIVNYAVMGIILATLLTLALMVLDASKISLFIFISYISVTFFFLGMSFGNLNSLAMEPMGKIAGVASAIIGAIGSILSAIVSIIIGQLYDDNLYPLLLGILLISVITFIIQLSLKQEPK